MQLIDGSVTCGENCEPNSSRGSHDEGGRGKDQMQHQDYWMALKDFEMGALGTTACSKTCALQMKTNATSTYRRNQVLMDMNKTAHPPLRTPSQFRPRSFPRRGAMNHLLGLGASHQDCINPSTSLQCPAESLTSQSKNIAITPTSANTALSASDDSSVLAYGQPITSSDFCISNLIEEGGDRIPFDDQQLRQECLNLQINLLKPDQRRTSSPSVLYNTLPTSSRHYNSASRTVPGDNTAKYSVDDTAIRSLDTHHKSYLSAASLGDFDASAGLLLCKKYQDYSPVAPGQSVKELMHVKSRSTPNLASCERASFAHAKCSTSWSREDLLRNRKLRKSSSTNANLSTSSKISTTPRRELATPIFRRVGQSGEALSKMVNTSLLSLKSFSKRNDGNNHNLLFEEMKVFDDRNLLNFVKGRDSYYSL